MHSHHVKTMEMYFGGKGREGKGPHAVCPVVAQLVSRSPVDLDALGDAKRVPAEKEKCRGKRHAALDNL